jgi:hypothetical protein
VCCRENRLFLCQKENGHDYDYQHEYEQDHEHMK